MDQVKDSPIGKLRMALYGLANLPTSIVGLPFPIHTSILLPESRPFPRGGRSPDRSFANF